jgi:hypothetical protein
VLLDGTVETAARVSAGRLFPTFYMIAKEELYPLLPGEETVALRDREGRVLAEVTPAFRKAVMYQGTSRLADGRIVHIGPETKRWGRTFEVLAHGILGLGIQNYRVYPWRSAAVDFDHLCRVVTGIDCVPVNAKVDAGERRSQNRKRNVGTLLFLPRLVGVPLPDGSTHDGHVCAVDIGGGIRGDRIDLFVGTEGGGNPYYPDCQSGNAYTRAGIRSLVPWDWLRWEFDPRADKWIRVVEDEYRTTAPDKGLEVFVVQGVRCRKEAK